MFAKQLLFFVVAIFGIFAAPAPAEFTDEEKELMLSIHNECMKLSGATDEMAANAMVGKFSEDPAFKEHLLCASKKLGFMTDNGDLQPNIMSEKIKMAVNDAVDQAVKMCAVPAGSPQDTAFEMAKCLFKARQGGF